MNFCINESSLRAIRTNSEGNTLKNLKYTYKETLSLMNKELRKPLICGKISILLLPCYSNY